MKWYVKVVVRIILHISSLRLCSYTHVCIYIYIYVDVYI